jgi:predicted nucleic acid-binding protein
MKAVLDTNVVMDVLTARALFVASSEAVLNLVAKGRLKAAITANTITDIAYLLRKHCPDFQTVRSLLANLMELFEIIEISRERCLKALELPLNDYEDALLAECAKRWGADLIISRNLKDFVNSPVPAITPGAFLKKYSGALGA